jgi:hypothetical protein
MSIYTNHSGLPLSIAVWLANDTYDHDDRENLISATSLLKPLKQFIMSQRVDANANKTDIVAQIPSSIGTAIHDSLENAWTKSYKENLAKLGIPQRVIDRVRVNPVDRNEEDIIPVYLEQRTEKEIDGYIISGKFDFVGDGRVEDLKTTSVYTYINKTNDEKYIMQGSLYRWLNPDIITQDTMAIQFVFTDWSGAQSRQTNYPKSRTLEHKLALKPVIATELFVKRKLAEIVRCTNLPEEQLPPCSDEDLWRKPNVYKYYKDSQKTGGRSTKNYTNQVEADIKAAQTGGIVIKKGGEVVACRYCAAFPICKQKDKYLSSGELILGG